MCVCVPWVVKGVVEWSLLLSLSKGVVEWSLLLSLSIVGVGVVGVGVVKRGWFYYT